MLMYQIFEKSYKALDTHLPKFFKIFIPVLLGMALLLLLLPNSYWANDNVGIINVIKLGYTTSFMAAILGKFLSLFYMHISSDFPWYAVFLYLIHGLSITLFIYAITWVISNKAHLIRLLLLYLVIYSVMILRLGYNGASIMIGANALFFFCLYIKYCAYISNSIILLLGLSFSLSYLLRTRSMYAVIAFSFLSVLLFFFHLKSRKYWYILLFLLPVILLMGLNNYYTANYTSSRYKEYREYNALRGKIHDYPISRANMDNEELLAANNWSKNDYIAFSAWFFIDENTYSKEKLSNIFKYSVTNNNARLSFKKIIGSIGAYCYFYLFYLITLVLLLIAIAFYSSRRTVYMSALYSIYCLGGMFYMNEFYRFPDRIGVPIFLLVYIFLILIFIIHKYDHADDINNARKNAKYRRVLYLFYAAIFIFGIFNIISNIKNIPFKQNDTYEIVESVNKLPSNSIVMFQPATGIEPVFLSPLRNLPIKSDLNIITGGWHIFSERYYHQIRQAGAKEGQDLVPFLINSGRLYLVIASKSYKRCVETYFREHCKDYAYWVHMDKVSGRIIYWVASRNAATNRKAQIIDQRKSRSRKAPVRKSKKIHQKRINKRP